MCKRPSQQCSMPRRAEAIRIPYLRLSSTFGLRCPSLLLCNATKQNPPPRIRQPLTRKRSLVTQNPQLLRNALKLRLRLSLLYALAHTLSYLSKSGSAFSFILKVALPKPSLLHLDDEGDGERPGLFAFEATWPCRAKSPPLSLPRLVNRRLRYEGLKVLITPFPV